MEVYLISSFTTSPSPLHLKTHSVSKAKILISIGGHAVTSNKHVRKAQITWQGAGRVASF